MGLSDWISLITMVVLTATATAIFWYSWETRKMRKEIINYNVLSIRPLIAFHSETYFVEEEGLMRTKLFIKNVGYGVAKNVKIDKLEVRDELEDISIIFVFPVIIAIMVGENVEINKIYEFRGEGPIPAHLADIGYHFGVQEHIFNIIYEDLMERKYFSKVKCGRKAFQFLEIK